MKQVIERKFPTKHDALERLLSELPFEIVYTPDKIDKSKYPDIRDKKDLPNLVSAIIEDIDVLLSGDADFISLDIKHPEILSPRGFVDKYLS